MSWIAGLIKVLEYILLAMTVICIVVLVLSAMYRNNRLMFWCLVGALGGHVLFAATLYGAGILMKPGEREYRVHISAFKLPEPPKKKIPEAPKSLDLPLGSLKGDRHAKKMPKGHRLDVKRSGTPRHGNPGRPMVSGISNDGDVPVNDAKELLSDSLQAVIDTKDISSLASGGSGGEDGGTPDGEGSGPVPAGFPEGKINGRVYFIRLKHGSGAWDAYDDGTKRLLSFLNQFFPCENESRAITAAEMREKFMNKGAQPTFLYLYCDVSFSLSSTDVIVLREYMDKGGFLFLDSRPDKAIREAVAREMDKVLPGSRLMTIPNSNSINSFLFRVSPPGFGENFLEQKNYGISRNGRLVVFYSMGNLSHIYAQFTANSDEYYAAQYQMGANVMLYAIRKGDASGIDKRAGAKSAITTQTLERLNLLEPPSSGNNGGKPPESVKVKPPNGGTGQPSQDPDDIKLIE